MPVTALFTLPSPDSTKHCMAWPSPHWREGDSGWRRKLRKGAPCLVCAPDLELHGNRASPELASGPQASQGPQEWVQRPLLCQSSAPGGLPPLMPSLSRCSLTQPLGPCPLPWQRLLRALPSLDTAWMGPSDQAWPPRQMPGRTSSSTAALPTCLSWASGSGLTSCPWDVSAPNP